MKLAHFFLPHSQTHKKAHLISPEAILIYCLLIVLLQVSFNIFSFVKPGVLGISSQVEKNEIIKLTNQERKKMSLPLLEENAVLDEAARKKAQNMFEEDYWAHYSPSGKDPWGFITGSGYKYSYAGENLARNFYESKEVVRAWMASPTHKDNIVNPSYEEIGIAVVEGTLKGERTTLVVQMFGSPVEGVANETPQPISITAAAASSQSLGVSQIPGINSKPFDFYTTSKTLGLSLLFFLGSLIVLDMIVLKKRGVVRISSRHLPHLALLGIGAGALINMRPGSIL